MNNFWTVDLTGQSKLLREERDAAIAERDEILSWLEAHNHLLQVVYNCMPEWLRTADISTEPDDYKLTPVLAEALRKVALAWPAFMEP